MELGLGLATFAVALMVAGITLGSYVTSRDTLRVSLFEDRFSIYKGVQRFLLDVLSEGKVPVGEEEETALIPSSLAKLLDARQRSRFMFGAEIGAHIDEIYTAANRALALARELEDKPKGPERTKLVPEQSAKIDWLIAQLGLLQDRFAPYLAFTTSKKLPFFFG